MTIQPSRVSEATLRYYRCSPQKARLVVDQIRGKDVNQALSLLRLSPKTASHAIEKLLRSAVANADRGPEKVDVDTLYVGEAYVGPGPSFKRYRGRAFGRAFRILHRTCHITLKLDTRSPREAVAEPEEAPAGEPEAAAPAGGRKPAAKRAAPRGRKPAGKPARRAPSRPTRARRAGKSKA